MSQKEGKAYVGNLDVSARKAQDLLLNKAKLGKLVDWATAFSLWPVHLTTSCCGCEFAATWSPRFDAERYGALPWIASRQTNFMIIEGTVTKKMAKAVKVTWEQMPYPKFAIAMGACALDGGIFYNSYNIVRPWQIIPIDVFIPGCPPRPEAVARAIIELQKMIRTKGLASQWIIKGYREEALKYYTGGEG
ncbi:MAG: NADH-quinone oxidoreductase subunit NuoB [Desulfurococcales archaeon]|nr:NADH-quinone oxidoreductase subunit NuoB [Desulfurococcales archaeon]